MACVFVLNWGQTRAVTDAGQKNESVSSSLEELPMGHEMVATKDAPAALGPYAQAVRAGEMTFLSGQIALDPDTGHLVGHDDVEVQTRQVMQNLLAVLAAADHLVEDLVKTTIYLADINDFAVVNVAYAHALGDHRPARATVEVSRLPKDALVEIDAIAVRAR